MAVNYGSNDLTTTGNLTANIKNYNLVKNILGDISGSVTINLLNGHFVTATVTGAVTNLTFSGHSSINASGFILELTNGGSFSIAWPNSVKWSGGTAPSLTISGVDVLAFVTDDDGTTWRGVVSMLDSK
jgi:hypothetical protein